MDRENNLASDAAPTSGNQPERERIEELIRMRIAASTGASAEGLKPGIPLGDSGLDSIGAVDLKSHLEALGADIPLSDFFSGRTIADIALQVQSAGGGPGRAACCGGQRPPDKKEYDEGSL